MRPTSTYFVSSVTTSAVECNQSLLPKVEFLDILDMRRTSTYFVSSVTTSMWAVWGNISTGCTSFSLYPFSAKYFMSLASVLGLHET